MALGPPLVIGVDVRVAVRVDTSGNVRTLVITRRVMEYTLLLDENLSSESPSIRAADKRNGTM